MRRRPPCRSLHSRRHNPGPEPLPRRRTTEPPIGSRCPRSKTERSPSPMRGTVLARPTKEKEPQKAQKAHKSQDFLCLLCLLWFLPLEYAGMNNVYRLLLKPFREIGRAHV